MNQKLDEFVTVNCPFCDEKSFCNHPRRKKIFGLLKKKCPLVVVPFLRCINSRK